jgi:hypothetical protein
MNGVFAGRVKEFEMDLEAGSDLEVVPNIR